jgi:hypothetical protein
MVFHGNGYVLDRIIIGEIPSLHSQGSAGDFRGHRLRGRERGS